MKLRSDTAFESCFADRIGLRFLLGGLLGSDLAHDPKLVLDTIDHCLQIRIDTRISQSHQPRFGKRDRLAGSDLSGPLGVDHDRSVVASVVAGKVGIEVQANCSLVRVVNQLGSDQSVENTVAPNRCSEDQFVDRIGFVDRPSELSMEKVGRGENAYVGA